MVIVPMLPGSAAAAACLSIFFQPALRWLGARTRPFYEAGSYRMSSWHECFCCGWHFRTRAQLAGAFLVAVHAADPRPTDAPL